MEGALRCDSASVSGIPKRIVVGKDKQNSRLRSVSPGPQAGPSREGGDSPAYVVGVGASAGGLEALGQFLSHLPADSGLAYVVVSHLEPTHKGMMPELLQRQTAMRVAEAADGMLVQPNHLYVIPPNADLSILHGRLQVLEPVEPRTLRMPIDHFFRHLALDQRERAIGILLSGMGSDGTLGLRAIKEVMGLVMVQEPTSAQYDGMPRSALRTGMVDIVAPAEELPARLLRNVHHLPQLAQSSEEAETPDSELSAALQKVFVLLRVYSGNDFSCYKTNTIARRIERRMGVHQLDSLPRYVRFLQENPHEVELLYRELLIGVTNFFRDPQMFEVLREKAIPQLLADRPAHQPLRIWNPGCSTGEETYSLAILLRECCQGGHRPDGPSVQMFATDIDNDAIAQARQGTFSAGIAADVSPERLARFFLREGEGYRVRKEIRDLVIFAPQNILIDPPFTKLDVLCCRNLFIYLRSESQAKLLPLLHYALNPGGLLILGTAESLGSSSHLFTPLDSKWKIFQRREVSERLLVPIPARIARPEQPPLLPLFPKAKEPIMEVLYVAQRVLLDRYGPPAVIVNGEGDIIYVNGRTGKYLESPSGRTNVNVLAMAREGLREELGLALHNAAKQNAAVTQHGVRVKSNGDWTVITLTVQPLVESTELRGMFLVVFEEQRTAELQKPPQIAPDGTPGREVDEELRRTRERLQATVEEMQAAQEELHSTNEELQSNNEELQSTNEELTSSKEELQSLNEEMQTVNAELQAKIDELSRSNSDMKNLLNGTEIATIFLGSDLAVKRFTASASRIVPLVASDAGRPISHFTTNLKYERLLEDAQEVLETLVPKETQVQAVDGRWYNMRVLPYRTLDNVIDGVVMTFADISVLKETNAQLQAARSYAESIVATVRQPLLVLDGELRIVSANRAFYGTFRMQPSEAEGRRIYDLGKRQWDIPALRQLLEEILSQNRQFEDFRMEHEFPTVGHKVLLLNGRRLETDGQGRSLILLAMEDLGGASAPPD